MQHCARPRLTDLCGPASIRRARRSLRIACASGAPAARVDPVSGGDVAQLGERLVRNEEVVGSIPIISTILLGLGQVQRNPEL